MTNADRGGAVMSEISRRIQKAYEWDSMAEGVPRGYDPIVERTAIDLPAETLATYVGSYEFSDAMTIVVTLEDGALFAQPTGQGKIGVFAESEETFFLKVVAGTISFTKDDSGAVTAMTIVQGGGTQTGTRVP
jgi:hypothetical protein